MVIFVGGEAAQGMGTEKKNKINAKIGTRIDLLGDVSRQFEDIDAPFQKRRLGFAETTGFLNPLVRKNRSSFPAIPWSLRRTSI
jgi:hypothetical protein